MKNLLLFVAFAVLLVFGVCAAETVIYENDFSNPATLSDFEQYCLGWEISDGGLRLTDDKAVWSHIIYQSDSPLTEYIVEVDYMNAQTAGGIVFNVQQDKVDEQQNGFYGQTAFLSNDATRALLGCTTDTGEWKGNINVGDSMSHMGANIHIRVRIKSGKAHVLMTDIDSKKVIYDYTYTIGSSTCDQGFMSGTAGLRIRSTFSATLANSVGTAYFDNFKITTAAALEPNDYGYYDANDDGKTELVDVLLMLRALVNDEADIPLLRVIRTVKASTDTDVVSGTLTAVADGAFTLKKSDGTLFSVPAGALGIYAGDDLTSYVGFPATLSRSVTDADKLYAAKVDRDHNTVITLTADSKIAYINGQARQLPVSPQWENSAMLAPAYFVADSLQAELTWNSESSVVSIRKEDILLEMPTGETTIYINNRPITTTVPATLLDGNILVPFLLIADVFTDSFEYDSLKKTITAIDLAEATLSISDVTTVAGSILQIPIQLKNNPGITGIELCISYDENVMSYISAKGGSNNFYTSASTEEGANPIKIVLANLSLKRIVGTVDMVTLSFRISENAVPGKYTLTAKKVEAFDENVNAVQIKTDTSTITIKKEK